MKQQHGSVRLVYNSRSGEDDGVRSEGEQPEQSGQPESIGTP